MALLDQYGRPVMTGQLTTRIAEAGLTGVRNVWAGSVASGLTPYRLASILRACDEGSLHDFAILAEEMEERDPHYFSVLGMRKRAVSGVAPVVAPASEDAQDIRIADEVRANIADHDGFSGLVEDLLDALGKGFAVVEIDWEKSASAWRPRDFIWTPQHFFRFDRETGRILRLLDAADVTNGVDLAPFKFIAHQARMKSGLVFRGGLARVVAFSWMCKSYDVKDWMAFVETYGLPLRLGRYGPEASKEDIQKLFSAVANIGTDAAAVLPKSMEIEFTETKVTGDKVFENLARYIDEQISKAVLGQTMTADNGSSNSQAQVHNEVRHDIAAADARAVQSAIMRDLVKPYVDLNFGVQKAYPKLSIPINEPEDVGLLIDKAVALMGQGVRFKAGELRAKIGFSDPEAGDEVAGGTTPAPQNLPPAPRTTKARNRMALNAALDALTAQDEIDVIEAEMLADWEEVMSETLDPIEAVAATATSYDDLKAKLATIAPDLGSSKLIDALVKGMFKARGVGDQVDG